MSFNNNRNNNINKPKVYYNPFTNMNNHTNSNFKGNHQNNKTHSYYHFGDNPANMYNNINQNNRFNNINQNNRFNNIDRNNRFNNINQHNRFNNINQNNRFNNIDRNNKFNNQDKKDEIKKYPINNLFSDLKKNNLGQIESIEIIPMNISNNSDTNGKQNTNINFLSNLLKNIIFNDTKKDEKDEQEISVPEFIIDLNKDYEDISNVKTLDDLIELGKNYNPDTADKYAINLKRLNKLVDPLIELKNTIGMTSVKESILDQLIYFLQSFEENNNMLHTIIEGPPGVGKTMLGYILGKIYYNMGILKGSKNAFNSLTGKKDDFVFKIVKRKDLIGEYLGHTAIKTQKVIDDCKGGVLFIDEAYSLGNIDKKDTYSKECIDTINQNLSEGKTNFMCIIAGYPEQLENCFFSYNEGLKRRFTFKYTIEKYNGKELTEIFKKMVNDSKWELNVNDNILEEFITKNINNFENFGGDMETLLFRTKITHSKRVFGIHPKNRKKITIEDIQNAYKLFLEHKKKDKSLEINNDILRNIYM
jgi:hypothetical protein